MEICLPENQAHNHLLGFDDEIRNEPQFDEIVVRSAALQHVFQQVEVAGPTESGVL